VAQIDPGLDEFGGEIALRSGVDGPAQAELIDVSSNSTSARVSMILSSRLLMSVAPAAS
jgi:hypothetical protein